MAVEEGRLGLVRGGCIVTSTSPYLQHRYFVDLQKQNEAQNLAPSPDLEGPLLLIRF